MPLEEHECFKHSNGSHLVTQVAADRLLDHGGDNSYLYPGIVYKSSINARNSGDKFLSDLRVAVLCGIQQLGSSF